MEKGYRLIKCPGSTVQRCNYTIRILGVTEKQYGKKGEVRCPKCDVTFETTIHAPGTPGEPSPTLAEQYTTAQNSLDIIDALFSKFGVKGRK